MSHKASSSSSSSSTSAMKSTATIYLQRQFQQLKKNPVAGFAVSVDDDLFEWTIWIAGPQGSPYAGGSFKALMKFPMEFPDMPPKLTFVSSFWHPNVYQNGDVCISILHPPGNDQYGYERAEERWSPIQSVSSVLLSVIAMLSDPNTESPANIEASIEFQRKPAAYNARIKALVAKANSELPPNFEPIPMEDAKPHIEEEVAADFYMDGDGSEISYEFEDDDGFGDDDDDGEAEEDA